MKLPLVFQEIIETDEALAKARASSVIPFETHKLIEARRDLTRAAEHILHWNTDKGSTA